MDRPLFESISEELDGELENYREDMINHGMTVFMGVAIPPPWSFSSEQTVAYWAGYVTRHRKQEFAEELDEMAEAEEALGDEALQILNSASAATEPTEPSEEQLDTFRDLLEDVLAYDAKTTYNVEEWREIILKIRAALSINE